MRRIIRRVHGEGGAASVLVAILMVVLLGFAALVIDVGLMYSEKAQLQNGADAAALSIAQTCAENDSDPLCAEDSPLAKTYADGNANDGLANVQDVSFGTQTVTVTTGALEEGGDANNISLFFANALGIDSAEIGAVAQAGWGGPSKGYVPFSIAFSKCEVDSTVSSDGSFQFLKSHGADETDGGCHSTSSGLELPGGFGWIDQTEAGTCSVDVDLEDPTVGSDPGNNLKAGCSERLDEWKAILDSGEPLIELFPVFDDTNGLSGDNGEFHLHAFAAFDVRGWNFTGGEYYMLPEAKSFFDTSYNSSDRGFVGKFVRYVSLDEAGDFGGSTEYGAKEVSLTQ